ncbi:hypothetical protein BGZ98_004788 [Dissophora globulifera]|nr:hypothetical protein BGZ98_004788 [Dissophora globulifera]
MMHPRIPHPALRRSLLAGRTLLTLTRPATTPIHSAAPLCLIRFRALTTPASTGTAPAAEATPDVREWSPPPRHIINGRWQPIIGLEIHAQLKSTTKLFSDSKNIYNAPINTNVSLIDAAYPGTLPQLSKECVDLAVKTSLALDAHVYPMSSFDRKHYFYPDLPHGYQITQHYEPLAQNGKIVMTPLDGLDYSLTVGIEQLQLEQDTGKSLHDVYPGLTLLDLNRAGTGLMEIVTKPDMRSSQEAGILVKKLQTLLRAVGSSDGNMDEANAEIKRQIASYESNTPIVQETRGYDASTGKTFRIRSKESAPDYRYMPEPDLPRLVLTQEEIHALQQSLPELPDARRGRIMEKYQLSVIEARTLMGEQDMVEYFESLVSTGLQAKSVISWTIHELLGRLNVRGISFSPKVVNAQQLGSIVESVDKGQISAKIGKSVLDLMIDGDARTADAIVQEKGWKQMGNHAELEALCDDMIARHPEHVAKIQGGNVNLLGFFIGQIMKDTKGRANPVVLSEILKSKVGLPSDFVFKAEDGARTTKKKKGGRDKS